MFGKNCKKDEMEETTSKSTSPWKRVFFGMLIAPAALFMTGCDVDVESTGEMPDVDVEGGEAPEIEVTPPEIETGSEEIEVPTIDIDPAEENEQ